MIEGSFEVSKLKKFARMKENLRAGAFMSRYNKP
jgi:hypothetical protein